MNAILLAMDLLIPSSFEPGRRIIIMGLFNSGPNQSMIKATSLKNGRQIFGAKIQELRSSVQATFAPKP